MAIAYQAQRKVTESLNAQGRSPAHVATGLAIGVALIGLTTALSLNHPQPPAPGAKPSRQPWVKAIWPSLFSVTTLAALRVWNARSSPARSRALTWWSLLQASNLAMTIWRPTRRGEQLIAALTTAGLTSTYVNAAARVDRKAAAMTAPTGFAGLATLAATPR